MEMSFPELPPIDADAWDHVHALDPRLRPRVFQLIHGQLYGDYFKPGVFGDEQEDGAVTRIERMDQWAAMAATITELTRKGLA
jgi:hypothetical protein